MNLLRTQKVCRKTARINSARRLACGERGSRFGANFTKNRKTGIEEKMIDSILIFGVTYLALQILLWVL